MHSIAYREGPGAADGFLLYNSIDETLDLYKEFYVLDGLSKPWGPGAHFKCICENCFKDCTCHHSIMLSLLCKDEAEQGKEAIPLNMPTAYRAISSAQARLTFNL
jgi:hypothetical protein